MEHLWVSDYMVWLDCRFCATITPVDMIDSDPTARRPIVLSLTIRR